MTWLFKAFFKYPAFVFEQGDFRFAISRTGMLTLLAAAVVAGAVLVTYRRVSPQGDRPRDRVILMALRLGVIAVLLFCMFRPLLVLKAAVPQQNFIGILIDDSRSMAIADRDGKPRTDFVKEQLSGPNAALLNQLSQKFVPRIYGFSSSAERVRSAGDLKYEGTTSRLGAALERARDELSGLPLAGLVMISDGADTSEDALDESLASLKARTIPVFTVGVGQERFDHDVEVTRIETPRSILKGTALSVDVVVRQSGYSGQKVALNVEDGGKIVASQDITLPADGESSAVRVTFTANDPGPRLFHFTIATQNGEQVTQNNTRTALIEVMDRQEKVLYFEGEPRFEEAFIRRAIQDDKNLQVVKLVRMAENKYWRGDVSSPEELPDGFPKTREELFAYKALILGSVDAATFTSDQLSMLADFVSKRGGGLLMLGGRRSFSEGGWSGTPLAEVLPVSLTGPSAVGNSGPPVSHLSVRPTRAGSTYPVIQLAETDEKSNKKWNEMPTVTSVNPIPLGNVKPGATTLLTGLSDRRGQEQIVLAYQRYGRGKAVAFPIQDSWNWKMDVTIPVTDTTYATFWRRMIRWLVDGVPEQVSMTTSNDRVEPGEQFKLTAEVVDPAFVQVNDAHVSASITSPSGKSFEIPLEWSVSRDGEYTGTFVPDEAGLYEVKTVATRDEGEVGSQVMHLRASAGDSEYFDAAMRAPLLKRIAEDTGGHFFTPNNVSSMAEAISYSGRGVTVVEERDLWDMPVVFVTLLGLMGGEWLYRRKWGMA
jgi:uncharacterized membrane protein